MGMRGDSGPMGPSGKAGLPVSLLQYNKLYYNYLNNSFGFNNHKK